MAPVIVRDHRFALPAPEVGNAVEIYVERVERACQRWEGRGEALQVDGGPLNNRGPDIDEMLAISGVGRRDSDGHSVGGPWCGVGASAMCVLATGTRDPRFAPFQVHAGAKRLVKNIAAVGSFVVDPQRWRGSWKGDIDPMLTEHALAIAWHRGFDPKVTWPGHVELLPRYDPVTDELTTWSPNTAPPTSVRAELNDRLHLQLVRGQAVWHRRTRPGAQWRRRLSCIATLASARST